MPHPGPRFSSASARDGARSVVSTDGVFVLAKNRHEAHYTSGVITKDVALGAATNAADFEWNLAFV
jgi:hypothetical protein